MKDVSKQDGRKGNGGARQGSGPKVRRIHLDKDTARELFILVRERRILTPDLTEHELVAQMIRERYAEAHAASQAAAITAD